MKEKHGSYLTYLYACMYRFDLPRFREELVKASEPIREKVKYDVMTKEHVPHRKEKLALLTLATIAKAAGKM